jgi:hypothetical protein
MQSLVLDAQRLHFDRGFRMRSEESFDLGTAYGLQLPVHIGMQVDFADRRARHLI